MSQERKSSWKKGVKPKGRVWALVLWEHSYDHVPEVRQYSPKHEAWYGPGISDSWKHSEVEWHPLPHHERYALARTHEVD